MASPNAIFLKLQPTELCELEALFARFEQTWSVTRLSEFAEELRHDDARLSQAAMVELVKIDLERQWALGYPKLVEDYLAEFPSLGTPESTPADIIQAEVEVRRSFGESAAVANLDSRFPTRLQELQYLVAITDTVDGRRSSPQPPITPETNKIATSLKPHDVGSTELTQVPDEQISSDDRFAMGEVIGEGAFGTVYRARDKVLQRDVAIKVPMPGLMDNDDDVTCFLAEARAAAGIRDAGICAIYDVVQIGGRHAIVMPYLKGRRLDKILSEQKSLEPAEAIRLVLRLAKSLEHAHAVGIVHRDVKPANVLVSDDGWPVLMDFGLAKLLRTKTTVADPGVTGTPAYMSPEQALGNDHEIGPASDIYSLGVILYQMLAGCLPFTGSVAEVLAAVAHQQPLPPSSHRASVDCELDAVCLKALNKVPHDRYCSMGELAAALETHLYEPTATQPATHRRLGAAVLLVTVALAIVIVIRSRNSTVHVKIAEPETDASLASSSPEPLMPAKAEPVREFRGHDGEINCVAFAPDGNRFASGGVDGTVRVWEVATGQELLRFSAHDDWITEIAYSPDGQHIVSCSRPPKDTTLGLVALPSIRLWDVTTGKESQVFEGHLPWTRECHIYGNGKFLLTAGQEGTIKLWDVATGEELREIGRHNKQVNDVVVSHDLRRAVSCDSAGVVRVSDLESGQELAVFQQHRGPLRCVAISTDGRFAASGGFDRRVRIWNLDELKVEATMPAADNEIKLVRFSPHGRYLFAASAQSDFRLWEWRTKTLAWRENGRTDFARAVDVAPDWKSVLSAGKEGIVRLWALPGVPEAKPASVSREEE